LHGALELGAACAGADHFAARKDNGVEVAALAPERARHGFVEEGEPLIHPSLLDQTRPDLSERAELEIEVSSVAGELLGLARQLLARRRIPGLGRLHEKKPASKVLELEILNQPRRTREPAGGGRGVADIGLVVNAEHERDRCGLHGVRAAPKLRVRPLSVVDGVLRLPEPPQCLPDTVQSLCGLAEIERCSEGIACGRPLSGLQRGIARRDQSVQFILHVEMLGKARARGVDSLPGRRCPRPVGLSPKAKPLPHASRMVLWAIAGANVGQAYRTLTYRPLILV
jgi:hypothetical protein